MEVLGDDAIGAALEGLEWTREGGQLVKRVSRSNFGEAMVYVNSVAQLAEGVNHHPDIDVRWSEVILRLSTHSAGGITQADLELAAAIDGIT